MSKERVLSAETGRTFAGAHGSAITWQSLDWPYPDGRFQIYDDGDPHGILAIILPGGQLMTCSGHSDEETDMKRAKWIADALNEKRDRELSPNVKVSDRADNAPSTVERTQ